MAQTSGHRRRRLYALDGPHTYERACLPLTDPPSPFRALRSKSRSLADRVRSLSLTCSDARHTERVAVGERLSCISAEQRNGNFFDVRQQVLVHSTRRVLADGHARMVFILLASGAQVEPPQEILEAIDERRAGAPEDDDEQSADASEPSPTSPISIISVPDDAEEKPCADGVVLPKSLDAA